MTSARALLLPCALVLATGCASTLKQSALRDAAAKHVYEMPIDKVWPHVVAVVQERGFHAKQDPNSFILETEWKESMEGSKVAGQWTKLLVQGNRVDGAACTLRVLRWDRTANSTLEGKGEEYVWKMRVKGDTTGMAQGTAAESLSAEGGGAAPEMEGPSLQSMSDQGTGPTQLRKAAHVSQAIRDLGLEWEILQRADPSSAARLEGKPVQAVASVSELRGVPRLGESGERPIGDQLSQGVAQLSPEYCGPEIPGLESLTQPGATLLLGEFHGTQESPKFVGRVACHAGVRGRPVAVGLQLPASEQPSIDRYLMSAGEKADRDDLLAAGIWRSPFQDGRSSEAMFSLIETLRTLRAAGLPVRIFYFAEHGLAGEKRDEAMAANVLAQRHAIPDEVLVVLAANVHPRVVPLEGKPPYVPMGARLAEANVKVVSLAMAWASGTMWSCAQVKEQVECGRVEAKGPDYGGRAFVRLWPGAAQDPGYHGLYYVGPVTASAPAVSP